MYIWENGHFEIVISCFPISNVKPSTSLPPSLDCHLDVGEGAYGCANVRTHHLWWVNASTRKAKLSTVLSVRTIFYCVICVANRTYKIKWEMFIDNNLILLLDASVIAGCKKYKPGRHLKSIGSGLQSICKLCLISDWV